jgi:TPR repeat protein
VSLVTRYFLLILLLGWVGAGSAHVSHLGWDGGIESRFHATSNLYQSAKEGSTQAQVNLAKQLIDFDTPEFDGAALYWISQAAEKDTEAKFLLGEFYV